MMSYFTPQKSLIMSNCIMQSVSLNIKQEMDSVNVWNRPTIWKIAAANGYAADTPETDIRAESCMNSQKRTKKLPKRYKRKNGIILYLSCMDYITNCILVFVVV